MWWVVGFCKLGNYFIQLAFPVIKISNSKVNFEMVLTDRCIDWGPSSRETNLAK